ncbi:MAG TPA: glucose-6-phosphate isomerase [Gemmatimonadales bacterium]|nr:glucose-6-phosphate isomerase [Gemmatimonadales bacterium]
MIRLHYGRMLQEGLDGGVDGERGISRERLAELARRFPTVQGEVRARRSGGDYGFYDLIHQEAAVREISAFAEGMGQAHDHVLVLGIGGSALGTKALLNALRPPAWNELSDEGREFYPRLTVLENVDPTSVAAALRRIDPRRVLVNVISKSGGTAETMAQYLVVRHWLEEALGPAAARHFVFTTDPKRGALREIAERDGIPALDVPSGVGGRYSVLSPVGLLPAALVGIDIEALLTGAARAVERAEPDDLMANAPALFAALLWASDTWHGGRIHVLMPYSDRLRELAEWFRQLWAESLGKARDRRGALVNAGPTPVGAVGATDQHSQVQLFMEGPYDKAITFVRVEDPGEDVTIPALDGMPDDLSYLGGHSLGELLLAELDATSSALARMGRMNQMLTMPDLGAGSVGELLMFLQVACGYAGVWYNVDPFDQPGVELGKRLTFTAMGRAGFNEPLTPRGSGDQV